jgi:hypothetical protein
MGILFRSRGVRQAALPRLESAFESTPGDVDAAAAASGAAAEVESQARETTFDWRVFAGLLFLVVFIVIAGIVTEYLGLAKWDERLVIAWGWLVPLLVGYIGGEFVSEKTK